MIYIVYPERRYVTEETIAGWFADAVENREISPEYLGAKDTATMVRALNDAGIITTARPPENSENFR